MRSLVFISVFCVLCEACVPGCIDPAVSSSALKSSSSLYQKQDKELQSTIESIYMGTRDLTNLQKKSNKILESINKITQLQAVELAKVLFEVKKGTISH